MDEERLIDIETRIAYQEDSLQLLNDVVTKQQKHIDRLQELLKSLAERCQSLQVADTAMNSVDDEKPPHY